MNAFEVNGTMLYFKKLTIPNLYKDKLYERYVFFRNTPLFNSHAECM